jgi:hypothetical protein
MSARVLIALSLLAAPLAHAEENPFGDTDKLRIAVTDLKVSDEIPDMMVSSFADIMTETLDKQGAFKAISMRDIARMMDFEAEKQGLGCSDDSSCLAEMVGALGAQYLVTGSVALVGEQYLVQLQLFDIDAAKVSQRESRDFTGAPSGLLEVIEGTTKTLVRELLKARAGTLKVVVNENDATIRVDDRIVGVSPLPAFDIAGGSHKVEVEKEGFITAALDVDIAQGKESVAEMKLRPSAEFRDAYAGNAWMVRGLAFAGMGVGALGLVTGGGLYGLGFVQAEGLRDRIDTYNAADLKSSAEAEAIQRELDTLNVVDAAAITAALVGTAALAGGAVAFLIGPDPGRYDVE